MSQSSPGAQTYKVAHLNRKGIDFVFVPLDGSFSQFSPSDQSNALKALQHAITSAGLKGSLVLVWDKGNGQTGLLAEKHLHGHLAGTNLANVTSNLNRQLTVQGLSVVAPPWTTSAAATVLKAANGTIAVAADLDGCEVFLDGVSVGLAPVRAKTPGGSHVVEVKREGYESFRQEVMVASGGEASVRAALQVDDTIVMSFEDRNDSKGGARGSQGDTSQRKHRVDIKTMLFTDIVGSTKLKQELGDREAVKIIQWHHGMLRGALGSFATAHEISTSGDSFFLVFAKPSDAVKFALIVQSKLRKAYRESGRKLYDRIGIHVGEVFVEEVAGEKVNDCYGIQVDTCARVMSLGEGDQILMTRFAFDNARQVLKGGQIEGIGELQWVNHGMYSLKGVEEPLDICEVGELGLAILRPPPDSEKVQRFNPNEGESVRAPGAGHVVVSTKSVMSGPAIKPFSFGTIKKQG